MVSQGRAATAAISCPGAGAWATTPPVSYGRRHAASNPGSTPPAAEAERRLAAHRTGPEGAFLTGNSNRTWLLLDHGWNTWPPATPVSAAVPLPATGDNFLRWLLCDPDLPGRLLNHDALTTAVADPDHPALRTLREQFPDDDPDAAPDSRAMDRPNSPWVRTPSR
ncbi:hypothetical protein [Streptomyces chrestomyceticus]|uniref:Uncharacterized protein n=1 Tax=Streptomyces chrestomyceticus TaxID=68185 RepID=A0ABU7X669_9ACTN